MSYTNSQHDDHYRRTTTVSGTIVECKNIIGCDTWGKSSPYCVVKGIRCNSNLVQMYTTRCRHNDLNPRWNGEFSFSCPIAWGFNQLVGLKFFLYHSDDGVVSEIGSDDFLGGAELDLYDAPTGRLVSHTLSMEGLHVKRAPSIKPQKRTMLAVKIRVMRELVVKPELLSVQQLRALQTFHRITNVKIDIVKAKNLRDANVTGRSDPVCRVRALTLSGECKEIYRTAIVNDDCNPVWNECFDYGLGESDLRVGDEPALLLFDIYDDDGDMASLGDHLGSAMIVLADCLTGVARRKRLHLQSESQLLEKMLDKEGRPKGSSHLQKRVQVAKAEPSSAEENVPDDNRQGLRNFLTKAARGVGERLTHLLLEMKNFKLSRAKKSSLFLELTVQRQGDTMPLAHLLSRPIEISDRDHVDEIMQLPDWQRSMFEVPRTLAQDAAQEGRFRLATLRAKEKIVFICGVVRGCSGLMSADIFTKSDPYCIIEGVTLDEKVHFIHRTRVIGNRLCPEWKEVFFFAVPEFDYMQRLNFFVYDSDYGDFMEQAGDDFLGRTSVDLSQYCPGDRICEEYPLTGCKAQRSQMPKLMSHSFFRRSATISVDIRVVRCPAPVFDGQQGQNEWKPPARHRLTRQPDTVRPYWDAAQQDIRRDATEQIGAKVLSRLDRGILLKVSSQPALSLDHAWLEKKALQQKITSIKNETEDEDNVLSNAHRAALRRRKVRAIEERDALCDLSRAKRSGAPARARTQSLPLLHSKFGHGDGTSALEFARTQPDWIKHLRFNSKDGGGSAEQIRKMTAKPDFMMLT